MDKKLKAKWIAALRSDEYPQGTGNLQKDGKYCCLGVLREVAPAHCREVPADENKFLRIGPFSTYVVLSYDEQKALATLNDAGVPFEMLAGLIREAL